MYVTARAYKKQKAYAFRSRIALASSTPYPGTRSCLSHLDSILFPSDVCRRLLVFAPPVGSFPYICFSLCGLIPCRCPGPSPPLSCSPSFSLNAYVPVHCVLYVAPYMRVFVGLGGNHKESCRSLPLGMWSRFGHRGIPCTV